MKKESIAKNNKSTAKQNLTEGLKRKCAKWKQSHSNKWEWKSNNTNQPLNSNLMNENEATSPYSNTDFIQKEPYSAIEEQKEFSSLLYMSKRINDETKDKYVDKFISQISAIKGHTKNLLNEEQKFNFASIEEWLETIKQGKNHRLNSSNKQNIDDKLAKTDNLDSEKIPNLSDTMFDF